MIHQDYTWVKPDGLAQLAARQIVALEVVRSKLTSVTNNGRFVVYMFMSWVALAAPSLHFPSVVCFY